VATFADGWTLWERAQTGTSSFLWVRFKLQLPEDTPRRNGVQRGYRLNWNPLVGRLARSTEVYALSQAHPELYDQVVPELALSYPKSWLTDAGDYTQAEIDAEIGRLNAQRQLQSARAAAKKRNAAVV
jgi:hypothetical protein